MTQGGRRPAPSILTFITADMMAFGLLFVLFMIERAKSPALFDRSARSLDADLGALNTIILLTSSWLVMLGVDAARAGDRSRLRRFLSLAMLVGSGFAVTKMIEYTTKITHGTTMLTNDFFSFYFILTGIHFLHFAVGMGVLAMLWVKAGSEPLEGLFLGWITSGGIYWHMVDLLWIMLFPMLYLLGAA